MAEFTRPEVEMSKMTCPMVGYCIPQETVIEGVRLAAAYVPFQKFCTHFSPLEGLMKGTAFPELVSPYDGREYKYKMGMKE
jgi:hypothetical protein